MATEAQLIEGLRRADAAGNVQDAQQFAAAIKKMRSADAAGPALDTVKAISESYRPMTGGEYARGLGANVIQGLTAGFGDEAAGVAADAGLSLGPMSVTSMMGQMTGTETPQAAAARDQFRGVRNDFAERRPVAAILGNIAGSIPSAAALPISSIGSTGARALRAGGMGAAYGGVTGLGEGEGDWSRRAVSAGVGALTGGAIGAAAETASALIGRAINNYISKTGQPPQLMDQTGALTPQGRDILKAAGMNADEVTPDFIAQLQESVNRQTQGVNAPVEATARQALADSLPVPVPLTRGQKTLDPNFQGFEYDARAGTYGDLARNELSGADARAEAALRANMGALQRQVAGGVDPIPYRGAGGEAVSARLNDIYGRESALASSLYDEAGRITPPTPMAERPFGDTATRGAIDRLNGGRLSATPDENFATFQRADIRQSFAQQMMKSAWDAMAGVDVTTKNARGTADALSMFGKLADGGDMPIADVFQLRRTLTALQDGLPSADTKAAREAKAVIDRFLGDAIKLDVVRGDTAALEAWKKAISNYHDFAVKFKSDDLVGELVSREGRALKVTPEAAANSILGTSDLAFISKPELANTLVKMRDILGADSREWNGLREEFLLRIFQQAEGAQRAEGRALSGAKLSSAIDGFATKNRGLWNLIFSPAEQTNIRALGQVMKLTTVPVDGAKNYSGTAAAIGRMVKTFGGLGVAGKALNWLTTYANNAAKLMEAQSAAAGIVPSMAASGPSFAGAAGGVIGNQGMNELRRDTGRR